MLFSQKNEKSISEKINSERECSVIWKCFNQEKIFQRKQISQDRNIYISIIFTLEFLFWLCGINIIFQMHVGLQNSRAPRNTCFYKVKKSHILTLNRTPENKTNTIDKQILANSHWNNPNRFHSRENSKSAVCQWMRFLNIRNKQKPPHRKVRMLNPSISAFMGLNSISRAKEDMVIVMPTPGGSHPGLSKAWGIPRPGSPPSLKPTNKREPEAQSPSY